LISRIFFKNDTVILLFSDLEKLVAIETVATATILAKSEQMSIAYLNFTKKRRTKGRNDPKNEKNKRKILTNIS